MDDLRASKLFSLILRHDPEHVGLQLHPNGWLSIPQLLDALTANGYAIDREQLERIVRTSDKQRFAIDRRSDRIRANQGHSINVDLGLPAAIPPDTLFHGTPRRNLASVRDRGLDHGQRLAVHLSTDVDIARRVGARRGSPVVLAVDAGRMHRDAHRFTVAANGVWLVLQVPPEYLTVLPDELGVEADESDATWPYLGESDVDENFWEDLRGGDRQSRRRVLTDLVRADLLPNDLLYSLHFEVMAQWRPRFVLLIRLDDRRWGTVELEWESRVWPHYDKIVQVWSGRDQIQAGVDAFAMS